MVKIILGNIWRKSEGKQEKTAPFTIEDKVKHSAVKWQLIVWNCWEYKGKVATALFSRFSFGKFSRERGQTAVFRKY